MVALEYLAGIQFGALTEAELHLLQSVPTPESAWCSETKLESDPANDPKNAHTWPDSRSIRAELFVWLCTEKSLPERVNAGGLGVFAAWFRGKIDFSNVSLKVPITLNQCWLPQGIDLDYGEGPFFDFTGTRMRLLHAWRLVVHGDIWLSNTVITHDGIDLTGAQIDRDLDCENAEVHGAFLAEGIRVGREVILCSGFQAFGKVNFDNCKVDSQFDCSDGQFENQGDIALSINGGEIGDDLILSGKFRARGGVDLTAIDVGGQLDCEAGHFLNRGATALSLNGAKIQRDVFLNDGFRASGLVDLIGAEIDGILDCSGAKFVNFADKCLTLKGAEVTGKATIGDGSLAVGQVDLDGAKFGADLDCTKSRFSRPDRHAVSGVAMTVQGIAWFDKNKTDGMFDFRRVRIGSDMSFAATQFVVGKEKRKERQAQNEKQREQNKKPENGLDARAAKIGGTLSWKAIISNPATVLRLRDASVGILDDDEASWLDDGRMTTDGFEYGHLSENSPRDCASRKRWLDMQKQKQNEKQKHAPQPYNQLAGVFRASGRDADSTEILIAKEEAALASGELSTFQRIWKRFLGCTVRYGYEPLYALRWAGFFVALGIVLFGAGYRCGAITPTEEKAFCAYRKDNFAPAWYEPFSTPIYSLETFLPLVDFDQRKNWFPNPNVPPRWKVFGHSISAGGLLRIYLWIHTVMGWFIAAALGAGIAVAVKAN
jgi:hypothetical protein